jgi:hypothetical protein
MIFSPFIQKQLKHKSGVDFQDPSDAAQLALDIETVTGEHVGVNTMKRLLGMIDDEREPRVSTLNIVARYLGYADWAELRLFDNGSNSDFGDDDEGVLVASSLSEGSRLSISYAPDRVVSLCHLRDDHFVVEHSVNSKLKEDDEIVVTHFVKGYPLLVGEVIRNGRSLGRFVAGRERGINFQLL